LVKYELFKKNLIENIILEDFSLKISLSDEIKIDTIDSQIDIITEGEGEEEGLEKLVKFVNDLDE
jgi:hypothetical protein